jgi:hypothetical protein
MQYLTITYNQRDAMILQPNFIMLQTYFTEIPTKKCVCPIPGLVSRSFRFLNQIQDNLIKSLSNRKFYLNIRCILVYILLTCLSRFTSVD